jgi:Co-chaperonin GroES (HSP10)
MSANSAKLYIYWRDSSVKTIRRPCNFTSTRRRRTNCWWNRAASNAQEKPQTGKVVAVGSGRVLDNGEKVAPSVKEGDTVLFDKYAGTEVKYNGDSYLVVHEKDLVAIVD